MLNEYFKLAFTAPVQEWQERFGSRAAYDRAGEHNEGEFSEREIDFIEARDAFFLASVSATGWPYVQHRGGPPGFVRHIRGDKIGWAEFAGNRQYVSSGNVAGDTRVALIFLDFARRRRLKLLGHLSFFEERDRPDLALRLMLDGYRARIERLAVVEVAGFDWNCPQHITPRFTRAELASSLAQLDGPGRTVNSPEASSS